jgi:hypothetical protein
MNTFKSRQLWNQRGSGTAVTANRPPAVQPRLGPPPVYRPQPAIQPKAVVPPVFRPQAALQNKIAAPPVYLHRPAVQAKPIPSTRMGSVSRVIQLAWAAGREGPDNFNPVAALAAADFTQCTYVQAARAFGKAWRYTVYGYAFVEVDGYSVCVVAHAHIARNPNVDADWRPGNVFIPGWENWSTATPAAVVTTLRNQYKAALVLAVGANANLPGGHVLAGQFPGNDRYPFPVLARAFEHLFG